MDFNDLKLRVLLYIAILVFLSFLSWLCASNFDETELKLIGGFATGLAAIIFGREIRNKVI